MAEQFIVNAEAAIYRGDEWLMVVRSPEEEHAGGTLSLPGGTVEHADPLDDIIEAALAREVAEEIGVVFAPEAYVRSSQFVTIYGDHVLDIVLMGPHQSSEPTVLDHRENSWVGWMALAAIEAHPSVQLWTLKSIRRAEQLRRRKMGQG